MANAQDLLDFAAGEVGYDRYSDPEKGTKYGRWYESEVDRCADNYDFGGNGVAFCAMFASYCLAKVGVECAGFPGAYCPSIHHKQHLKVSELRAGDVVLFDWEDDGTDDHVGFVVSNDASARVVRTIEGNTNGGKVARRTRAWSTVCGGIRPKYGDAAAPDAKPAPTKPAATTKEEKVYKFATIRKGSKGNAVPGGLQCPLRRQPRHRRGRREEHGRGHLRRPEAHRNRDRPHLRPQHVGEDVPRVDNAPAIAKLLMAGAILIYSSFLFLIVFSSDAWYSSSDVTSPPCSLSIGSK